MAKGDGRKDEGQDIPCGVHNSCDGVFIIPRVLAKVCFLLSLSIEAKAEIGEKDMPGLTRSHKRYTSTFVARNLF